MDPNENGESGPRAEELIVTILAEKDRRLKEGLSPARVILTPGQYRVIQEYRGRLGEAPSDSIEYLTKYEVFGLEICVEGTRASDSSPAVE
jgi:hypothetical protein